MDAQVVPATSDPTGTVSSGFLLVQGPFNEFGAGSETEKMKMFWDDKPAGQESMTRYMLPLYSYQVFDPSDDGDDDYGVFIYLIIAPSENQPNCYTRCGIGRTHKAVDYTYPAPETWAKVISAPDAQCEKFLGPEVGHRFRII